MTKCIHTSLNYDGKSTLAFFSHFEVDLVAQGAVLQAAGSDSVPAWLERVWRTAAV